MSAGLIHGASPSVHPPRSMPRGAELGWGLLTAVLAIATAAIPLVHEPAFYFTDDYQSYFLPGFLEIARLIKAGELPFLTPRLFQGGAFLAEYQYALFNPVSLLLYLALDGFARLDHAAAFFALVHVGLLAGGTHALARLVGVSRPAAVLAGLTAATSGWIIYWGAITWIPGLVSTAWLSWAAAALIRAYRDPGFVPLAAAAIYLTITSGWPFSDAALIVGLSVGLPLAFWVGRDRHTCLRIALTAGLGGLLAAPSWMPLAAALGSSSRQPESLFSGMLSTPPSVLLALGVPIWPETWLGFSGATTTAGPPTQYVSWWVPAAIVIISRARLSEPEGRGVALLLAVTGVIALLAISPGVSQLRWPFRFLPYVQIGFTIVAAWLVTRDRWALGPTLALIAVGGAVALARDPDLLPLQLTLTALVALAAVLALQAEGTARLAVIAASHAVVFAILTAVMPFNGQAGTWPAPMERSAYGAPSMRPGDTMVVLHGKGYHRAPMTPEAQRAVFTELPHSNTPLLMGAAVVGGYSPMPVRGFRAICMGYVGVTCPEAAERLARPDPVTGASTLDLARVVRVAAEKGPRADGFASVAGPDWTRRSGAAAELFERVAGAPVLPGTLSAGPAGFRVAAAAEGAASGRYKVASPAGGRIVWARAWYPGYAASWNGAPLAVEIVNDFLVSTVVPAGDGVLDLRYVPAGLFTGLAVSALAAIALAVLTVSGRRTRA
ncbi:hypothetical protein ASF49_21110 [Methylobacterium sp. Leaf104]|uniref:hypothetical protein n=1 Tax=Methylobacterium TaxID=407 RepID=UPI0006FB5005|nr:MULTISPECIES: hypothetical protein [Methylobacterium]KQP40298.1 hypothetical protein ASF49_21110 [Methylobacterium sp. Leaf104]MCI9882663.1 hypothetical protein [Methylobacterium goesingense]